MTAYQAQVTQSILGYTLGRPPSEVSSLGHGEFVLAESAELERV
jgi:hypothetical protein